MTSHDWNWPLFRWLRTFLLRSVFSLSIFFLFTRSFLFILVTIVVVLIIISRRNNKLLSWFLRSSLNGWLSWLQSFLLIRIFHWFRTFMLKLRRLTRLQMAVRCSFICTTSIFWLSWLLMPSLAMMSLMMIVVIVTSSSIKAPVV